MITWAAPQKWLLNHGKEEGYKRFFGLGAYPRAWLASDDDSQNIAKLKDRGCRHNKL